MLTLIISLVLSASPTDLDHAIGFVLVIEGEWELDGRPRRKLAGGDRLPPGATILPIDDGPSDNKPSITISFYTGTSAVYRTRTTLPARREPSLMSRIWKSVAGHFRYDYTKTRSRSPLSTLSDGVVKHDDRAIDLKPIVKLLPAGEYDLVCRKIIHGEVPGAAKTVEIKVTWDPERRLAETKPTLMPGLYEVICWHAHTTTEQGTAWVLVTAATEFSAASKRYADAVALVDAWDDEVKAKHAARIGFQRGFLASLAEDQEQSKGPAK